MTFEFNKVADGIYHANFPNRFSLSATFMRLGEYYESANDQFRGRFFHSDDFLRWYAADDSDYSEDWAGYNIPSTVIRAFLRDFPLYQLTGDELALFVALHPVLRSLDQFYLIATERSRPDAFDHEMAHAYYYLHPEYRAAQAKNLEKLPTKVLAMMKRELMDWGYSKEVLDDEIQAYMSTGLEGELNFIPAIGEHIVRFTETFQAEHKRRMLS